MLSRTYRDPMLGGRAQPSRHTHGNIYDVNPSGYAKAGTPRTSTPHLRLSQGAAKTKVIL